MRDAFNRFGGTGFIDKAIDFSRLHKEAVAGAVIAGLAAGIASYMNESAKGGQIPLAFSEYGHTVLYVEKINHQTIPPLTRFYAVTNDIVMQVFEAHNIAFASWGGVKEKFSYELDKKINPAMRIHKLVGDYAKDLPDYARDALQSVKKLAEADRDLRPIIRALDKSWNESHNDVYRTETTTRQVCDSEGKNCKPVTEEKQVYDHTTHSYYYNSRQGNLAAQLLNDFKAAYPDLKINESLLPVTETGAENEWAMRESRKYMPGYKDLKGDDYIKLANVWATGSNYMVLTPKIEEKRGFLAIKTPQWDKASKTAHSDWYNTPFHSDDGPREYRIAKSALEDASNMSEDISRLTGGIQYAAEHVPEMAQDIARFVNINQHGEKGSARGLDRKILREAREIYTRNYAGGFNPYPSNWFMMVVWSLMGTMAGAGAGYGVERYKEQRAARPRLG